MSMTSAVPASAAGSEPRIIPPPPCRSPIPPLTEFVEWARGENEHQRRLAGVHAADHLNADLRGRTYFEVNLYRYYATLRIAWPYLHAQPNPKILDVGSWPGVWLRIVRHYLAARNPKIFATGLIFPDNFMDLMAGACDGTIKCELDPWSPLADRGAPNELTEHEFTFISAMEVVEHLYHPAWMFQLLSDAMAPGGILVLTTNNVARIRNLLDLMQGGGLFGNLEQLVPIAGGSTGAWRPHMREYAWRELNHLALLAGFEYVEHGFFEDNYGVRLIENVNSASDDLVVPPDADARFVERIASGALEREQLKPSLYLVLRRRADRSGMSRYPARPDADSLEERVRAAEGAVRELLAHNHRHMATFAEFTEQNRRRDEAIAELDLRVERLGTIAEAAAADRESAAASHASLAELLAHNHHHVQALAEMTEQNHARDGAMATLKLEMEAIRHRSVWRRLQTLLRGANEVPNR
ncbi:MAG: methyltransferase domain-containing protein [Phycisphaerae bacterium]